MDLFMIGFQITNLLSILMFILVFAVVITSLFRCLRQWKRNEKAPRLSVEAQVIAKRTARQRPMSNKRYSGRDYSNYYATFQFESGDRLEFELRGSEYGLIVEGDEGKLTFQGTRYLGFERK